MWKIGVSKQHKPDITNNMDMLLNLESNMKAENSNIQN